MLKVINFKIWLTIIFDCFDSWEFAFVNLVYKLLETSPFVGDLLNLKIKECVFSDLDCFLKLFPVLYILGCLILVKVSAVVCILLTLRVPYNVDYFWILYPNIFHQAGKFANNAIKVINIGYVVSVNISDCFDQFLDKDILFLAIFDNRILLGLSMFLNYRNSNC